MRRIWLGVTAFVMVFVMFAFAAEPAAAHPLEQYGRPDLPDERTVGTEHFLIHYTLQGSSAVSPTDADNSGLPDYIELVADTLEYVWAAEINVMGWPLPADDGGLGGDERIDVYLDEILEEGFAGYVDTEGGFIGDNPLSPETERRAAFVYMVLDDDYAEADLVAGETPEGLMQATVAHEFNHALQAGIDDRDPHAWLYEATATWMEDEVYDDINDGVYYLYTLYDNPDICLVAEWARGDDLHWYSTWLLLRMMSEEYGPDLVRDIWANMRQYSGFGAIDAALAARGSTFSAEFNKFVVANLLRSYDEGDIYPVVRVEGSAGEGQYTPADGVQSLGADYVRLEGSGPLLVTLSSAGAPLSLQAVGIRGGEADLIPMGGASATLVVDPGQYDETYLIVHNTEQIAHEDECIFSDYTVDVEGVDGSVSPVASVLPAGLYLSPGSAVAEEAGVGDGQGTYRPPDAPFADSSDEYSASPETLNVAFDTLIPASLPPGYSFDYGYIMTEADFGDSAPYYVPSGGDTANFDYLDSQGNWLSIAESPSPYGTVKEWLNDIDYTDTPGEIRSISGQDVLVEDLSDGSEVWISATLIVDDLFIVVDGDHSEADVLQLVDGLIESAQNGEPQVDATEEQATPSPGDEPVQPTVPPGQTVPPAPTASLPGFGLPLALTGVVGIALIGLCCLGVLVIGGLVVFFVTRRRNR